MTPGCCSDDVDLTRERTVPDVDEDTDALAGLSIYNQSVQAQSVNGCRTYPPREISPRTIPPTFPQHPDIAPPLFYISIFICMSECRRNRRGGAKSRGKPLLETV